MDITTIASLSATLATLILAFVAILTLRQSRKQLSLLSEQIVYSQSQLLPNIRIVDFHFSFDIT